MLYPTLYFRPLNHPITLSYLFNITLRNPSESELPIYQQSIKVLCHRLSEKERKRILYTLYPLGVEDARGDFEEIFIDKISRIWVIASVDKKIPFEEGIIDYGYLCGYLSDGNCMMNPGSFIVDTRQLTERILLRALKKELPKASKQILSKSDYVPDIFELQEFSAKLDGLIAYQNIRPRLSQVAKALRKAQYGVTIEERFINYCLAIEILMAHNPSGDHLSKMPIVRQFSAKTALLRHFMIRYKDQHNIITPTDMCDILKNAYDTRSSLLHGRSSYSKKELARLINELFPTLRLIIECYTEDPLLADFVYNM